MNFKILNIVVLFFSLTLSGCGNQPDEYNEAIDHGTASIAAEEYDEAKAYFELALEEEPGDEQSQNILKQLAAYQEAVNYLENDELEKALSHAERIGEITKGSKDLNEQSEALIKEIQENIEKRKVEQAEAKEKEEEKAQAEQNSKPVEKTNEPSEESAEAAESSYEVSDFVGYYLHFDSDDRTHSDMIATIGYDYLTVGWYMSNFELYEVLDSWIEGNVLSVEYSTQPYGEEAEEYGTFSLSLQEDNGEKSIEFVESGMTFYEATYEEVLDYDYSIQEFLVEDMDQ